ncbi:PREDICTED: actin-binding protein IPP-like [Acropora digitifera]|uniref:actin-binding protein IPP-like n=1 Tax=Acropora digitifera TaxID=70779 RepID=UPI00077A0658|nr:PREDICTED: actin-binding protein IPP-like [Acropora digitifera]
MVAHSEILLSKCAQFREQSEFIDVRLNVGEDEFAGHRIVLAANSDYFHAMFAHGMKESNQEVIELKDEKISVAAMKIVMDSIYSGEINVNVENVFEELTAADHIQVTSVVQQCFKYLISLLSSKKWYHLTIATIFLILTPRLCTQDGKTIPHLKAKRTSFQQNIIFTLKKSTY